MTADGSEESTLWCCHLISSDVPLLTVFFFLLDYTSVFGGFIKVSCCLLGG